MFIIDVQYHYRRTNTIPWRMDTNEAAFLFCWFFFQTGSVKSCWKENIPAFHSRCLWGIIVKALIIDIYRLNNKLAIISLFVIVPLTHFYFLWCSLQKEFETKQAVRTPCAESSDGIQVCQHFCFYNCRMKNYVQNFMLNSE